MSGYVGAELGMWRNIYFDNGYFWWIGPYQLTPGAGGVAIYTHSFTLCEPSLIDMTWSAYILAAAATWSECVLEIVVNGWLYMKRPGSAYGGAAEASPSCHLRMAVNAGYYTVIFYAVALGGDINLNDTQATIDACKA